MKVVVCHPGKQHVNALLIGLARRGSLARFYTMFAANLFAPARFFSKKWQGKFQKYAFLEIPPALIAHAPAMFLLANLIKAETWTIRLPYAWFDRWAARRIGGEQFDIVIGYETANLGVFTTAKRRGKATVLDLAGVHHHFQNPVLFGAGVYHDHKAVGFISKKKDAAFAVTDYVLALSGLAERALVGAGFPADRIYRTHLGVNLSLFVPKTVYRAAPGGRLNLYFVGTLSRRKGLPFAVELLKNLRHRGLDIHLTLIGPLDDFDPGKLDGALFSYLPFVGHAELVGLHHALDLFIFPSNMDSWAQTVIEAMACGSPALVSSHTGAQDAVEQGGGMVLPVGDQLAWADAVETIYHDRALLKKMGERAAIVARQYTWEAYEEQVFGAMSDIMARRANVGPAQ